MRSFLIFTLALFSLFFGAAALPRLTNLDIFPRNATLAWRETLSCQCNGGSDGCGTSCSTPSFCCPANTECTSSAALAAGGLSTNTPFASCCTGNGCVDPDASSSSTSATPPTISSDAPSSSGAPDAQSTEPTSPSTESTSSTLSTVSINPPSSTAAVNAKSTLAKQSIATKSGASAGGVVGLLILLWALFQAYNGGYITACLFPIFGWWLFPRRRMVFSADKGLEELEITTFITTTETIDDNANLLTLRVFKIGHSRTSISCRCFRDSGKPKLGLVVLKDNESTDGLNWFSVEHAAEPPTTWTGKVFSPGTVVGNPGAQDESEVIFKNASALPSAIALGTFMDGKFRPFFRLNNGVKSVNKEEVEKELYIHAFVTNGYKDGGYRNNLIQDIKNDVLKVGVKLTDLAPDSFWHLSRKDGGGFKLEIK